jgi:hypothetical protein
MTISSTADRISYAGNGSTAAFNFPYLFFADADLAVILVVDSTGVETTQTLTTDYTITGSGDQSGGTVTMVTEPASGETLVIYRDADITQGLDLVENDPFPSDLVEQQFDKLTQAAQKLNTWADRTAKLTDGDTSSFDPTLPSTHTADTALVINAAGTGFAVGPDVSDLDSAATNATAAAASAAAAAASASAVGSITIENFDGTDLTSGGTVLTLLTVTPTSENQVQVTVNGTVQHHTTYTLSGAVITFGAALPTAATDLYEVTVGAVGIVGATGAAGATGTAGLPAPIQLVFDDTDQVDENKGPALLWLNNATHASATVLYIDDFDTPGADISAWVQSWDDESSASVRGSVTITQNAAPTNYLMYNITGAVTDATDYNKIAVTYVTGAGTIADTDAVTISFSRTGPAGSAGATTELDNLTTVALNVPLLPDAAAADDFGSATLPFKDAFFAGSSGTPGTNNFKITGASTSGTRVITLPDATDTLVGKATTDTLTNKTLTTPTIGDMTNATHDHTDAAGGGILGTIPQRSISAAETLVLSDAGKHLLHPSADTTARIWTIPVNTSVDYPDGTAITFVNQDSAGVLTIKIASADVMRLAGAGTTGDRTLAANGVATAVKVSNTEWIISGVGLT